MDIEKFINGVESIDWSIYKYNDSHSTQNISKSLIALALVDKAENNEGVLFAPTVYNDVLFALGNNHSGSYYPVVREALCFIIQAALDGNNDISKNCAINILWELFSFKPENGSVELERFVKNNIVICKDELIKLSSIHNTNSKLLVDFIERITEVQLSIHG